MTWLVDNWIWLFVAIAFIGMHLFGHGHGHGHGHRSQGRARRAGHAEHAPQSRAATAKGVLASPEKSLETPQVERSEDHPNVH